MYVEGPPGSHSSNDEAMKLMEGILAQASTEDGQLLVKKQAFVGKGFKTTRPSNDAC